MKKSMKQNALLNSIKQLCAVIFPLVTLPYITRVLGTENYGKVNFANSIVSYFALLAALGISNYAVREGAPLREDRKRFSRFADELFSINLVSSAVAYILLLLVIVFPYFRSYRLLILLQSLSILFTTIGVDWINTIYEDFGYMTLRYILAQAAALVCMFAFVKSPEDYVIYAVILVAANSGVNLVNIWYVRRYVHLRPVRRLNLKKHMKPLLLLFANGIAVTIYMSSDITLLGIMAGDEAVGIYTLSSRIYMVVKQVLNAVIIVTVPRLSLYLTNGEQGAFKGLLNKLLNMLVCMVLPVLTLLLMLSDRAMYVAGGEAYVSGSISLQILSLALAGAVFACFYSNCILLPARKDALFLKSTLVGAAVNILLNLLVIPYLGINGAALTTLLGEGTVLLLVRRYSRRLVHCHLKRQAVVSTTAACAGIVVVCLLCRMYVKQMVASTLLSMILSGAVYVLAMFVWNREVLKQAAGMVLRKQRK